tara:strand:- start:565 stop:1107 length:543 start_codon:yes stop_codon:yes gene_type:complete
VIKKKNRFLIFLIFNACLLFIIFLLSIPVSKFLNKINIKDNQYVKDQVIINPEKKSVKILDRSIKINFIAKVDDSLNWEFRPLQESVVVKIGENNIIKYIGENLSKNTITSTANFVASPEIINPYLIKTECFCFIEQTLKSGESKIFTMVFFIDPTLDSDNNFDDLKELVFTYEFSEYKS